MKRSGDEIAAALSCEVASGTLQTWDQIRDYLQREQGLSDQELEAVAIAIKEQAGSSRFPPITKIELFLTENCPLRCDYCFVTGKDSYSQMTEETALKAVDFLIRESRGEKEVSILFFGGEPLTRFDLIRRVVPYAEEQCRRHDKKCDFSMTTNGVLFTEESLAFCREHGLRFLLSIDGDEASHDRHRKLASGEGSFQRILAKVPRMKAAQPWMGARVTVHLDTVADLAANTKYLFAQGINQFLFGPANGLDWDAQALAVYEDQFNRIFDWYQERDSRNGSLRIGAFELDRKDYYSKRKMWGCRAGRHSITVYTNGNLYPCSKMLGLGGQEGLCRLGSLDAGITEIAVRAELADLTPAPRPKCQACSYADSCCGGCFAVNYADTGSIYDPSPYECNLKAIGDRFAQRFFARET